MTTGVGNKVLLILPLCALLQQLYNYSENRIIY
jgi:hypothetical protein